MAVEQSRSNLLLSAYRVLDLTDERGLLCGKILADLGADVVQVEPPGGSAARRIGPFYQDDVHPEKSLFWWAYTANKRGITLKLDSVDGAALLRRLIKEAHFLIESFPPGYLSGLGLGYKELEAINPELVMVSISPFGQDGPYSHYQSSDLVGMALGGFLALTGDSDRAPVRVGVPHFYHHGAAAAASGAMLAHTHRAVTGQGQHVDVSCQQAVAKVLANAPQSWDIEKVLIKRQGVFRQTSADTFARVSWRCKDGYINFMLQGGAVANSTRALLQWLEDEDMGDEYLTEVNWEEMGYGLLRPEVMDRAGESLGRFFDSHTKAELIRGSVERRILLFPVATQGELLEHPQLEARHFFQQIHHPELNASITYPGAFVKAGSFIDTGLRRRPPLIGEHNREIYKAELGLSLDEVGVLMEAGVI